MSLSEITIDGSLAFDVDEVKEIERGNLIPAGQRIMRVRNVQIEPAQMDVCGVTFGADDGLMRCTIEMQCDETYDEEGGGRMHTERLLFLHPSVDVESFDNKKLTQMNAISRRTLINIVKASEVEVPFDAATGKQDYTHALLENLPGALLLCKAKHVESKQGGQFCNLSGWKRFEE